MSMSSSESDIMSSSLNDKNNQDSTRESDSKSIHSSSSPKSKKTNLATKKSSPNSESESKSPQAKSKGNTKLNDSPLKSSPSPPPGIGFPRNDPVLEEAQMAKWEQAPSRGRRFTVNTRPDLHARAASVEQVDSDEDPILDVLRNKLQAMEDEVKQLEQSYIEDEDQELDGETLTKRDSNGPIDWLYPTYDFEIPQSFMAGGYLYKKGAIRTNWKKRFFVLFPKDKCLRYYKKREDFNARKEPIGTISMAYGLCKIPVSKKSHKNVRIQEQFAFDYEEMTKFQTVTRTYHLAALDDKSFKAWTTRLNLISQMREESRMLHGRKAPSRDRRTESYDDRHEKTLCESQNWSAFGPGLVEARVGVKTSFCIVPKNAFGNDIQKLADVQLSDLTVVLEDDNYHFDLVTQVVNDRIIVTYEPTRRGVFELSIMYRGFDIYGSPFHPIINGAVVMASHSVASGMGIVCAIAGQVNEFKIHCKDGYDEDCGMLEDGQDLSVVMSPPLVLQDVRFEGNSYVVKYQVDEATLQKMSAATATIEIAINDGQNHVLNHRPLKGSPFTLGVAKASNANELANAYIAHEFSQPDNKFSMSEIKRAIDDEDIQARFQSFAKLLKESGMFTEGEESDSTTPSRKSVPKSRDTNADLSYFASRFSDTLDQESSQETERLRKSLQGRVREIETEKEKLMRRRVELEATHSPNGGYRAYESPKRSSSRSSTPMGASPPVTRSPVFDRDATNSTTSSPRKHQWPLDGPVMALLEKHSIVLARVYEYYRSGSPQGIIEAEDVVQLTQDYDITPTFISRAEVRAICQRVFEDCRKPTYALFTACLAQIAIDSLSKPMFAHLYPTNASKVNVLLRMWGLADPIKLSEIQNVN